jgi:hypothetical protein
MHDLLNDQVEHAMAAEAQCRRELRPWDPCSIHIRHYMCAAVDIQCATVLKQGRDQTYREHC